jgi:hypothetical protein
MKKHRSVAVVVISVCMGAIALACWDYSSGDTLGTLPGSAGSTPPSSRGGSTQQPSGGASGGLPSTTSLPCDVLENAGLPCVSAHSTVRLVVSGYAGPLYQVAQPNGATLDVGALGGYADAAAQDAFCSGGGCVIKVVYDQSSMGNDLTEAPPGSAKPTPGRPVNAADLPVSIHGRSVYGILIRPGMGYRDVTPNGTAVADAAQTIYMVSSRHDLINGCCFDYGNAETTANNDGNGTMEAVYLGMGVIWGTGVEGGPWVMADLENGLYPGWENSQDRNISTNTPLQYDFVTAVVVGGTAGENQGKGRFALYGGNATFGALQQMYDGIRPEKPGYVPMRKQGSIILGIGGDNSNGGAGRFYEGVMANGAATRETLDALQAAIVAAGYER